MAIIYKVLGQAFPDAYTETLLYTAPLGGSAIVSSLIVCNQAGTTQSFSVTVSVGGAATTNKDYIYANLLIAGKDTFIATIGVTLSAGDVIRVQSSVARLSFSLYGSEVA
jgi:hypothetical protein